MKTDEGTWVVNGSRSRGKAPVGGNRLIAHVLLTSKGRLYLELVDDHPTSPTIMRKYERFVACFMRAR